MKAKQLKRKSEQRITTEMVADTFRSSIFMGFNYVGLAAAGYLIIMGLITFQTGGAL